MAIPYLGSKRKNGQKIFRTIKNFNPDAKVIVDLFCGGFAIGELFYKDSWQVIANDKNKYVIALLDQTINKGLDESIVTQWVSRDKFINVTQNPDKFDDWYVGYVQCVWSFGNNQTGYMFGKEAEPIKRAGHLLVIDKDPTEMNKLIPEIPKAYIGGILRQDNWHKRRLALARVSKALKTRILELQQLEQLQQLERLEQLQQLEQLQRLERLEQLEQLEIYSLSYDEVEIPEGAIIYCDPPYKGTAEYKEGGFNHDKFWEWVKDISKKNKIYISEYQAPEDFRPILKFPQKSTLQGGQQKHTNQPMECLFVPIKQENYNGTTNSND